VQGKTSREEWEKRVERWRDSGLTADQFASELGINAGTLKFWSYRLKKGNGNAVAAQQAAAGHPKKAIGGGHSFVELHSERRASAFEVELANGRRLHVPPAFEPSALERLLTVLERA
jgi:transposase-like protein